MTDNAEGTVLDARQAAQFWVRTWTEAWAAKDAEAIVALQAEDGVHWSSPFRLAHRGREGLRTYLLESFTAEVEPTIARYAEPVIEGDLATVEYWALCRYEDGPLTISGCTILRFGPDGLVAESRDYWFVEPGYVPFPARLGVHEGNP